MDSEYREPTWRGVLITLAATVLAIAGIILVTSFLLQQNGCVPSVAECVSPSEAEPAPGVQ